MGCESVSCFHLFMHLHFVCLKWVEQDGLKTERYDICLTGPRNTQEEKKGTNIQIIEYWIQMTTNSVSREPLDNISKSLHVTDELGVLSMKSHLSTDTFWSTFELTVAVKALSVS